MCNESLNDVEAVKEHLDSANHQLALDTYFGEEIADKNQPKICMLCKRDTRGLIDFHLKSDEHIENVKCIGNYLAFAIGNFDD